MSTKRKQAENDFDELMGNLMKAAEKKQIISK
jgi:hypothetical protein